MGSLHCFGTDLGKASPLVYLRVPSADGSASYLIGSQEL